MAKSAIPSKYACMLCSSHTSVETLVKQIKSSSSNADFIQLFDYKPSITRRLLPAYVNARVRENDGIARSSSVRNELILLVSGSRSIGGAIAEVGIKSNKKFIMFSGSRRRALSFARKNAIKCRELALKLDPSAAAEVVGHALDE